MKNVPNILSTLRLLLCPVFIWVFFAADPMIAFIVFLFASLLDVVDGYIARKYDAISDFGKIMDPLADKALQISGVLCLSLAGILENYLLLIILCAKELIVVVGGAIVSKKKNAMVISNKFGKFASFFMSFSICLMFFAGEGGWLGQFNRELNILIYIALVLSVAAMVQYGIIGLKQLKEQEKNK